MVNEVITTGNDNYRIMCALSDLFSIIADSTDNTLFEVSRRSLRIYLKTSDEWLNPKVEFLIKLGLIDTKEESFYGGRKIELISPHHDAFLLNGGSLEQNPELFEYMARSPDDCGIKLSQLPVPSINQMEDYLLAWGNGGSSISLCKLLLIRDLPRIIKIDRILHFLFKEKRITGFESGKWGWIWYQKGREDVHSRSDRPKKIPVGDDLSFLPIPSAEEIKSTVVSNMESNLGIDIMRIAHQLDIHDIGRIARIDMVLRGLVDQQELYAHPCFKRGFVYSTLPF